MSLQALVVEDDAASRFVYQQILTRMDIDVNEAADGQTAFDWLQQHTPHLIILDVRLPRMSGEEIYSYVRAQPRFEHTKIVILSAHHQFSVLVTSPNDQFLTKPVGLHVLRDTAQRALDTLPV